LEQDMGDVKAILGQMLPLIVRIDATMPHLATKAELHAAFGTLDGKVGTLDGKIGHLRSEMHSELGKLRADGHTFPIAIASGHSPDLTREALNSVSRLAFIEKPFDVSRLAAAVQRLLRPATAADPGRPVPGAA